MAILKLTDICKDYAQGKEPVRVLKNVNLTVEKGDYIAIMGPSGSGKTTLMNIIGCLDVPTSGSYELDGRDLKDLTDELFKYFLVFGSAELKLDMERYDGRLLLEQLASEAEFTLTEAGFTVQRMDFSGECSILADPLYLKRVMDNLVSNVMKYGDKARRVVILSQLEKGMLGLCVSNSVTRSLDRVESTRIGLRTCKRIMEQMQGSFSTETDGEHFAAELRIPAEIKTEATA